MSVILGIKKYAKNGNNKETHYVHVKDDDSEAIATSLSMLSTPVEGNEDMFKTYVEYANQRGGSVGTLDLATKTNTQDHNIIDFYSPFGTFNHQENYRFGLNNNDSIEEYLKEYPEDTVVMMDYTGYDYKDKLNFHFGEETPYAKAQRETFDIGIEKTGRDEAFEKMYQESLTVPWDNIAKANLSHDQTIRTMEMFSTQFMLDIDKDKLAKNFHHIKTLNDNTYNLTDALVKMELVYNDKHPDPIKNVIQDYLSSNIDKDKIDKYNALDRLDSMVENPRLKDKKESLYILPDGYLVQTPIANSSGILEKLELDYGIDSMVKLKEQAHFVARTLDGQIIKMSEKFKEDIRRELFDHIEFGSHELSKTYPCDVQSHDGKINGIQNLTHQEMVDFPGSMEPVDINGYTFIKGGENTYLVSPAGKELAFYKDDLEDKQQLIDELNKANQIQLYSINRNGGGGTNPDSDKYNELQKLMYKFSRYNMFNENEENTDIKETNDLIITQTSSEIQSLAKELDCDYHIDTTSVATLEKSFEHGGQLQSHIQHKLRENMADSIYVKTNIGDFKINNTRKIKYGREMDDYKQSFPSNFENVSSQNQKALEAFAQKLTREVSSFYKASDEYTDYYVSDLEKLAVNIGRVQRPTWKDVVSDELETKWDQGYYIKYKDKTFEHLNDLDNQIDDGIRVYNQVKKIEELGLSIENTTTSTEAIQGLTEDNPYKHIVASNQLNNYSERLSKDVLSIDTPAKIITFGKSTRVVKQYEKDESSYHQKSDCGFTIADLSLDPHHGSSYSSAEALIKKLEEYNVPKNLINEWGNIDLSAASSPNKRLTAEDFKKDFTVSEEEKPYFKDAQRKITSGYSTPDEIWGDLRPDGLKNIAETNNLDQAQANINAFLEQKKAEGYKIEVDPETLESTVTHPDDIQDPPQSSTTKLG